MAVDEVLLDGIAAGTAPPTLRFYGWTPPCLSLGYFQPFDVVDLDSCRALGVDIVRRPTGGRAILHDREVTYSVVLPASVLGQDGGVLLSYHRLSLALQDGLRRLGVPAMLAPASGESFIALASFSKSPRTARAVFAMALQTEDAIHDPPSSGHCGSVESPSLTLILSIGRPSMSAATCAMIV